MLPVSQDSRVIACCLRRKEGESRTFRSYTEEEIFFWVWFNRQEVAESHCDAVPVSASFTGQFVGVFCTRFWNMSLLFLGVIISLACPKQEPSTLRYKEYMLDREQPVRSQQETCLLHIWMKIDQKRSGIWSLETFRDFCHWGHYWAFTPVLQTILSN